MGVLLFCSIVYCYQLKSSDSHISSIESLPSISSENNNLIKKARDRSLFQPREQKKHNICLTHDCVRTGKCYLSPIK